MARVTGWCDLRGGFPQPRRRAPSILLRHLARFFSPPMFPFLPYFFLFSKPVQKTMNLDPFVRLASPTAQLASIVCNYFQGMCLTACALVYVQTCSFNFCTHAQKEQMCRIQKFLVNLHGQQKMRKAVEKKIKLCNVQGPTRHSY